MRFSAKEEEKRGETERQRVSNVHNLRTVLRPSSLDCGCEATASLYVLAYDGVHPSQPHLAIVVGPFSSLVIIQPLQHLRTFPARPAICRLFNRPLRQQPQPSPPNPSRAPKATRLSEQVIQHCLTTL